MKASDYQISSEKFVFHSTDKNIHDSKLQTKPVSYLKDAFYRFSRNKGSIFAFFIIILLVLFAIVVPFLSKYTVSYNDKKFGFMRPKLQIMEDLGIPFWDGGKKLEANYETYIQYLAKEAETGRSPFIGDVEEVISSDGKAMYHFRLNTYHSIGVEYILVSDAEYKALQEYQDRTGIQVIYPQIDPIRYNPELSPEPANPITDIALKDRNDANFWYKTKKVGGNKTAAVLNANGEFIPDYKTYTGKDEYTSSLRIEGSNTHSYDYAISNQTGWQLRVSYYDYYVYLHTEVLKDGITEPSFVLGSTESGQDLLTCLSSGARFSLVLAVIVATVNLFVGVIIGSIEGYYGGAVDMIIERFCDILGSVPFMIVITLLKYHLNASHALILFIAFFLTGWMGTAARTRMQFYRFKNQEYVLVSRTLGARDRRIMFKHILPNAIGTLITGSVLVIPSVIFSETSLSYLGIINLNTGDMTSVGTLLSAGQKALMTNPYLIFFPSLFISLLMLSFNLFGNGLRDAFNPSLRGTED